jgi:hypothetical protein
MTAEPPRLAAAEAISWRFIAACPFMAKLKAVRAIGLAIIALRRQRRPCVSAVEDFPAIPTLGARVQVGDERFDSKEIHRRYESIDFPLRFRTDLPRSGKFIEAADQGAAR